MFECKECQSVNIECTKAYDGVYKGREAMIEELECEDCGATGKTITPNGEQTKYTGSIDYF